MVDVKLLLEQLGDLVESIAWIDVGHDMRREDGLAFTKRVDVEIMDFVDDRELYKREI